MKEEVGSSRYTWPGMIAHFQRMEILRMFDARSIAYGKIRGTLDMFVDLNTDVNYQCCFSFENVEKSTSVQAAVEGYFTGIARTIKLVSLENQPETLPGILEYWLFGFLLPHELHPSRMQPSSLPPRDAYLLRTQEKKKSWWSTLFLKEPEMPPCLTSFQADRRRRWTRSFVAQINLLAQPTAIWEVSMPDGVLETCPLRSDTFAFEGRDSVFILHLGFCD